MSRFSKEVGMWICERSDFECKTMMKNTISSKNWVRHWLQRKYYELFGHENAFLCFLSKTLRCIVEERLSKSRPKVHLSWHIDHDVINARVLQYFFLLRCGACHAHSEVTLLPEQRWRSSCFVI